MRRSESILKRPDFSFNRGVYKSMGFSDKDLEKPIIGIANTWSELVPGSYNLRAVADSVKRGIYAAGGTPVEFGVIGACDGTAQGNEGMRFILPSRDLIANDVEVMVQAHQLDGIVLLGSCDKIVPGLLMAAARLKLPAILLPGGPMQGGPVFDERASDLTTLSEGCGMVRAGTLEEEELYRMENTCGPGCGSCSFYGTANTMCALSEGLGITLPYGALIPAVYADRTRIAFETGEKIVDLVLQDITADQIINEKSLENAIRLLNATGGSTNGVLHLLAVAREAGIDSKVMTEKFKEIGMTTPLVAKVNPSSKYNMEDFHNSGGIPQVMKELEPLLNLDVMTVTGKTVGDNLKNHREGRVNREIIRTLEEPFSKFGGIAILEGNLSPEGCITKPSAIKPQMHVFTGTARVFDSEETAEEAILGGEIQPGNVVVIRYEGPKGGPGMREMYKAMKYLYGMGLAESTALITDGRFSGTNNGCFVGHISPEAAEGGPIAFIQDGDEITVDIPAQRITLHVTDETLKERKAGFIPPKPKYTSGYLGLYSKLAASASRGAVVELTD
ncbi:dihydroxy-acid dehydratase [Clostridium sp. AF19-22AC]|uniref:dihydroxy-acid dehydratase n=1 Tax=Clostridia TaxID=186801 RepID=UPI000E4DD414|nr:MULTISPECIES: dihydroxy-acid dehydratase [Clostridia]RHR27582.1 dihydroxy-acid dehydratase [Clostridium sp. AF19-22AC]